VKYLKEKTHSIEVEEDILRILSEERGKAPLESIKTEISSPLLDRAIEDLVDKNLIRLEKEKVKLTENGRERAENILKKHIALEKHFEKTRTKEEAHKAAHILEHQISLDVIKELKRLSPLENKGPLLTECKQNKGLKNEQKK